MGVINTDEIRGYYVDQEMVCEKCANEEETKDLKEGEFITNDSADDPAKLFFCDRCKERL